MSTFQLTRLETPVSSPPSYPFPSAPTNRLTERDRNAKCIVQMKGNQTVIRPPTDTKTKDHGSKTFAFDKSYWSFDKSSPDYAGQENLHEDLGKPLLDNAFQGYNNCIFAYGQTGSGKSYSMMGYGSEAGVIPKICQDMFGRIAAVQAADPNITHTVEVSYLEIYNERVRDLLNPSTKGNLKVREHPSTGPYVEDLAKLVVSSFAEIENLMDEGNKARTVAATNMNETSSRSHAVFTLILTQKRNDVEMKMSTEKAAKISLVDLAGSERANSTGATGARLKEGAEINRSLSTLGRVISALADLSSGGKKKGKATNQVPYRDSVLTWLLKDSLGGNSMTAMIAAISPADINFDETLSTLRYADSAKRIKNHAVVNEDANARMIRELREELATLRSKLGGGGGGAVAGGIQYPEGTPLTEQIVSITAPDGTVKKVSKAEIAEQLGQAEKLYTDLNQTWEEKLAKTEEIHKERERGLEELGISIEKGFVGLHTPKKMPHLVNLSDDPLLTECLIYNLKPGTTIVGNTATTTAEMAEIRLNGSRILHEHCAFENVDGIVTLVPREGAAMMINGKRVTEPSRLRSGYRIILGDFHIFRFNHPQEARAERAERFVERAGDGAKSSLRHSVAISQLEKNADGNGFVVGSPSPAPRPDHQRNYSVAESSEFGGSESRPDSPFQRGGRDADWSFARREAAGAILGPDQKIAGLTDEELNVLFEDVQRHITERQNREENEDGDETASVSTTPWKTREKYMSVGTIDDFSLDTAITMPSTPRMDGEGGERLRSVKEDMQDRLESQKAEFAAQIKAAEGSNVEIETNKAEKARMEASLSQLKSEMTQQLEVQKKAYEERLQLLAPTAPEPGTFSDLTGEENKVARRVVGHWKSQRYVRLAATLLQSASLLKEAQILSQELDEAVHFQFTILPLGFSLCSSYDTILLGIPGDDSSSELEDIEKPCVAVRLVDYKNCVVHLWSLQKLKHRVKSMRMLHQYADRPEALRHFGGNPFVESFMPRYTLLGDVDVPLTAVFESRVQDFSLDVRSPYTSDAIGVVKLSLEPSSARAKEGSETVKFNVVMHELVGFQEHEGTEVHGQLSIPSLDEEGGVATTGMVSDFDEDPTRFDSIHPMSLPLSAPEDVCLRVSIFAKVSSMHLDKLLSWDDLRDHVPKDRKQITARINETQFYAEERHDVFARIQILELSESGDYLPVEVLQTGVEDKGSFQLHQGIQRRVVVSLTHSCGASLPWDGVKNHRVGTVQLLDQHGKVVDSGSENEISLKLHMDPVMRHNSNGTTSVVLVGQWDSSLHNSLLLDRVTNSKYKVQLRIAWDVVSSKVSEPMVFGLDVQAHILSRSYVRQQSMFAALWQTIRVSHGVSSIFEIKVRPEPVKKAGELWRMNTGGEYVKGEENLFGWMPRGVSLVRDFVKGKRQRERAAEIEAVKALLGHYGLEVVPRKPKAKKVKKATAKKLAATVTEVTSQRPKTPEPEQGRVLGETSDDETTPGPAPATEMEKVERAAPPSNTEGDLNEPEPGFHKVARDDWQSTKHVEPTPPATPDDITQLPKHKPANRTRSLEEELAEASDDDFDEAEEADETDETAIDDADPSELVEAVHDTSQNVGLDLAEPIAELEVGAEPVEVSAHDDNAEAISLKQAIADEDMSPVEKVVVLLESKAEEEAETKIDAARLGEPVVVKEAESDKAAASAIVEGQTSGPAEMEDIEVEQEEDMSDSLIDNVTHTPPEIATSPNTVEVTPIVAESQSPPALSTQQETEAVEPLVTVFQAPAPVPETTSTASVSEPSGEQSNSDSENDYTPEEKDLALKYITLWRSTMHHDHIDALLAQTNTEPPSDGVPVTTLTSTLTVPGASASSDAASSRRASSSHSAAPPPVKLLANVLPVPRNKEILKSGYLMTPSVEGKRWVKRFVELRRPYLHIYSLEPTTPGGSMGSRDEIGIVNLRNARVDHRPVIAKLLRREPIGRGGRTSQLNSREGSSAGSSRNGSPALGSSEGGRFGERGKGTEGVWAVYGSDNTWLFAGRGEREKCEWIFAADQAYFGDEEEAGDEEL